MEQLLNTKFKNAEEWLTAKGFRIIYSNHPSTEPREFHFIKDQIRIKVFISQVKPTYYCQVETPLNAFIKEPRLHIHSLKYEVGDDNIFTAHKLIKEYLLKLDTKSKFQQEHIKQTMWEYWFVASIILALTCLFIGTLEGSKTFLPNWPYAMCILIANLAYCLYKGLKPQS